MGYSLKKISKKIMFIFIAFISMFIYIGNAKAANAGDKYYLTYKYNTNPTGGNTFTYYNNGSDYNYYDINQQLDWSTNFKVEVTVRYEYTFRKIFLVGTEKIGGTTSSNNGLAISLTDDARVYVEAAGRSATSTNAVTRNRIKVLFEWDASTNTAKTTVYEYSGTSFDSGRSFSFTTYPIIRNSHSYSANNLRIGRGYEDSVPYKLYYESFDYSKQYSYDPNNGVELIAPTRINRGYVFRRWCSSSGCNNVYGDSVIMDSDKTAYSQYYSWNVDSNAGTPYMYGGETKIYGSGETIITTNVNNLDYPPGVNKYYSCGYSTDGTNFDHFTEPSTNNTFIVGATEYLGTRNYACYAYASDGFDSTPIMFVAANPDYYQAIVTILLPSIDFNPGDGAIPGDTVRFYGKYNTSNLYDTETGDNIVEIPIGFLDGHKFLGWYTSDDSSGEKIIDAKGNFVPNVSGWTNEDGKFIKTSNSTLYAKYKEIKEAYLIEGSTINGKFDKTNTTEFRRATLEEYNAANLTSDNIISTEDSPNVVYLWNTTIDSKVVTLYYTEADYMYMNADSSDMFRGLRNITELDLSDFITSNVTSMEFMFGYIGVTSLDLSTFDTSNVTKMNEMFFNSANLQELDLSSFDTSKVTTMVSMFNNCPSLQELDLSSFDTHNVRLMGSMFAYCSKLTTIYASDKWSTSGLNYSANQSTMFVGDGRIMGYLGSKYDYYWHGDEKAHIDGGPGNEGYFTDISNKGETHSVTFPDGTVELYNHNSIVYLDVNETTLGEYTSGEITFKYHNGNIDTTSNQVFEMAGDGFTCDNNHYRDNGEVRVNADKVIEYAYKPVITNSVFPEDPEKDGYIFMGWFTEEEGGEKYTEYTGDEPIVLHAQYGLPISYLISGSDINNKINYLTDDSSINEFRRGTLEEYNQVKDNFNDDYNIISTDESPLPTYMWYDGYNVLYYSDAENIYMNANSASMFSYTYASSIDVTEFDTSNVTDMSYMFSSGEMTELDLSHFNTSNVTNMTGMFDGCSSLQTIYVSNNWSTESLEDGNGQYMFNYDENLVGSSGTTYDENHIDEEYARPDEGVDNPGYFTLVTLYNVTYPNSSTRSYKDGTVINLGENDSPAIVETAGTITFKYHDDETEDTTLNSITTKTPNGFLVNDIHIDDNEDITINEDKVIEYDYDEEITGNEFPEPTREGYSFLGWYTDPENGELVESYNGEEDITLHAHWGAAVTSTLLPGNYFYPFARDKDFDTFRKATLEEYNNVSSTLTDDNIISTDDSDVPTYYWNQDGDFVYYSEADIIYLNEICWQMFLYSRLRTIDLSGLDSTKVTDTREMFSHNDYLTSINFTNFDTSNVTKTTYMFNDLKAIRELDLSNFNTSKVESAQGMFSGLDSIEELDVSSFDMSSATDLYCMFSSMPNLTTIYVSDKWDVSHYGENPYNSEMFYYVLNLTGYYGTVYSGDHAKWDYAHIDGGVENPGYLTHVSHKGETHTVTYPDGTVEIKKHNGIITLGDNNTETDRVDDLATITFKLHNGEDDIIKHVQNVYYANGFSVNGISYSNGDNVRINEDKVIDYNYTGYPESPEFPENPTDDRRLFLGWYTEEEDGDEVDYYNGEDDITLHAHWSEELLKLTVDGKTTLVEPGYVYTIPNGIPTENSDYITIYLEDSYNQDYKEVKISYGNAVNYQIIKGTKYYPGDTYVVNEDTNVTSNKSSDKTVVMDPYVEEPTYHDENGDYVFKGWIMANWDYNDPIEVNIDIYSLTPDDVLFDNQTFLADFEQINEEEQVRLTIIDDYRKNNYTYIVPKGLEIHPTDIDTDLHNSRRMYIGNNINDDYVEYNYEIDALISHYLINGEEVPNEESITRTINEDTTIEVVRVLTENEYCNDHETCPSIIYSEPYSRVSFDDVDNYIYTGIYDDPDGQGRKLTLSNFKPTGDPNGSLEGTVYMHFEDGTNNIILTVDDEASVIPKGMGVIPEAKEKADDVIPITLVYQDDETPDGVANMTYKHTFEGYKKQDYWRVYNPGEEYDYGEDTYFYSSYDDEWIYDELPYIDDDHFKGWWTEPEGGERVDELEYMRGYYEDYGYDTLYAHWGEPTVEICHGKGDCEEIVKGTAVVLERPEPTVTTAHFTLDYNTEEPGYEPKNVTTTRTETVEYFMINNERYDFGETYVFNENVDMYGVTTYTYTSDFKGYYSDNWDYGLNINGYELRGWCATKDGRYCRYYDEGDDIVQPDGLTLYATYYSSEGDTVKVTVDWDTTYDWPKGESEVLPDEKYNTIDFEVPGDYDKNIYFERNDGSGETLNGSIHVTHEFIGYRVGNDDSRRYQRHDLYTFYKDIHIQSEYDEVYEEITFPEINEPTFKGWYTRPEGGRKISTTEDFVKYMDLNNEFYLYAQYYEGLPTDMELDTDNASLMPGETYQIGVTFTPEGSGDTLTYTGYDDTKISVVDGLITGLSEGTTTITVGTENTDIEKTINVTIINSRFASNVYSVGDKEKEDQTIDRIIIGAEPETLISDFKSNLDNPSEYIKIYDGDNELSDDDIIKTGLTIRLEVNGTIYDEAIIIIRGDINQDGLVNLMDKSVLSEQLLRLSDIEGYGVYAADIDNNDSINLMDKSKLSEYLLRLIDTLNE